MRWATMWSALSIVSVGVSAAMAADLTVRIGGITNTDGEIRVGLHDSPDGFPRGRELLAGQSVAAEPNGVSVMFNDLAPGRYAIAAFHDQNGDAALNTNLFGLPAEPFGFSQNAIGTFGPPSFDDAAVTVGEDNLTIDMDLFE